MPESSTNWTVVERAGRGDRRARDIFARVYLPVVRRYVRARWDGAPWQCEIDDAVQQVLVECLKDEGALSRVSRDNPWGFRSYLFGVTRNVARSIERRRRKEVDGSSLECPAGDDSGLQRLFDRSFVQALLAEALGRHQREAEDAGQEALRRFELLRLRFWQGQTIREIARTWGVEPARLHHEYARARDEFRDALRAVLAEHCGSHSAMTEHDLLGLLASG